MAGTVSAVTDTNFQAEVIESDVPVLVDFWAPWCGPCRMVAPVVEEIAKERGEAVKVVKMNIDENQNTAVQFNVMSIPTLILFRNGQPAKTVVGVVYLRGAFYYHAWSEVWLGDWISLDSVLDQFPADVTHVKFLEGEIDRQIDILQLIGKLKIHVLEAS